MTGDYFSQHRPRPVSTVLSTTSYDSSDRSHGSTALTSPSLFSPKRAQHDVLAPMQEISEDADAGGSTSGSQLGAVSRGASVKDRARRYEQICAQTARVPSTGRTRSTSPLRVSRVASNTTPAPVRRVPVPSTAPPGSAAYGDRDVENSYASPAHRRQSPEAGSSGLKRGPGSARRMIQQWETGVASTSTSPVPRRPSVRATASAASLGRDYQLDKPLPIPRVTPTPSSSYYSPPAPSPSRSAYAPSPLQHLQTPTHANRQRSGSLTPSPSSYSIGASPSSDKKKKGRSPLKGFIGGIKEIGRLAKGKSKAVESGGRTFMSLDDGDDPWMQPVGTSGLPGGIVLTDRMGDAEMGQPGPAGAIRTSAIMYLAATPCSSVSAWGAWLTSWATLTPLCLQITYAPVFQPGHATPRRVMSGLTAATTATPAVAYASIPPPAAGTPPDVELAMADCVEIRSLRREEIKGRGIPAVPEGVGTEVLEMVFTDGSKRYIGVEGVGGRLGWVSAIWDVLLACKSSGGPLALPPPSPYGSIGQSRSHGQFLPAAPVPDDVFAPIARLPALDEMLPEVMPTEPTRSAPPVQKIGDTWVAASQLGASDVAPSDRRDSADALRDSVARMFTTGPDHPAGLDAFAPEAVSTRRESAATERIRAWQVGPVVDDDNRGDVVVPKTETLLSFDPNDLNPSRSASQVRRAPVSAAPPRAVLDAVAEGSDDGATSVPGRAPSHISHVTFPKPAVGGLRIASAAKPPAQTLPTIPAGSESSCETSTAESSIRTPRTDASSVTSADPTVLARLESHSTEHGTLAKQIDNVHVDLNRVALSLASIAQRPVADGPDAAARGLVQAVQAVDSKVTTIGLDVKAVENALHLSTLASSRQAAAEPMLPEVHAKLDSIARLCEEVLAVARAAPPATMAAAAMPAVTSEPIRPISTMVEPVTSDAAAPKDVTLAPPVVDSDTKQAGDEVAQIMADLTGGSAKSPRLGSLQVLHSAPPSPNMVPPSPNPSISPEATMQVTEILGLVKELQSSRTLQTQQTTDIARYLNELNAWLEKFVQNSGAELGSMSRRIAHLVGDDGAGDGESSASHGATSASGAGLLTELHSMVAEQRQRAEAEGPMGQRLDALLAMMGEDKERQAAQSSLVEQVIAIVERQRQDNQMLLQALARDLTQEIRGERVRFIDAMQQATSVNVQFHVEEFKKLLSAEVHKSMRELGRVREEKKVLQQEISDLFALKAKHGASSGENSRRGSAAPPAMTPMGRGLPMTPR